MKKVTRFFLMTAIALGLVACNKDEAPKSGNNGDGDVWASFTISMPSNSGFRAGGVDDKKAKDTYIGTKNEQIVKAVRVVLYDAKEMIVAYTFDFNITSAGNAPFTGDVIAGSTNSTFVTKAKKVVKKDYKALVLLNPTNEAKAVTTDKGTNIYKFEEAVSTTVDNLTKPAFFMSNAQGLVDVPEGSLKGTDNAAEAAPIKVDVDRAVAKVFVGGDPTVKHGDQFKEIKWTLDVTNKKTFLMRRLADIVVSKDVFAKETVQNGADRYARYAIDPNFTGHPALPGDLSTDPNFNYLTGTLADNKLTDAGFQDDRGVYVLENTMEAQSQYNSVTTRVVLRGLYLPQGFNEQDVKANGWYSYKGFKMDKAVFDGFLQKVKAQNNNNDIEGTPTGFAADIKKILAENPAFSFTANSFTKHNLKFYKGGLCYYYNIYIRHFDNNQSSKDMGYGRYGIVRNNLYKLTLGTISQPGEPEIEKPDPNQPDDPIQQYVSFKVEVLPWIVRTQTIDL